MASETSKKSDKVKIAELEAKVKVYESIIEKSNFGPMILDKPPIGFTK